jgi:hypothetical protein
VKKTFPPPKPRKQLEDVLQENLCKISLMSLENLYESVERTAAVLKTQGGPSLCDLSVV